MIQLFRETGITGWRRRLPVHGKPDFVFPRERVAVFVDGCFWHGCPRHCRMPHSKRAYWRAKIEHNKARDKKTNLFLRLTGWFVIRLWEHDLTVGKKSRKVQKLKAIVQQRTPPLQLARRRVS